MTLPTAQHFPEPRHEDSAGRGTGRRNTRRTVPRHTKHKAVGSRFMLGEGWHCAFGHSIRRVLKFRPTLVSLSLPRKPRPNVGARNRAKKPLEYLLWGHRTTRRKGRRDELSACTAIQADKDTALRKMNSIVAPSRASASERLSRYRKQSTCGQE